MTSGQGDDASPAPAKPKDFCAAMEVAAGAAAPAAESLDTLFDTMDQLAASAVSDADIETLVTAGTDASAKATTYVGTLDQAQSVAPEALQADLGTLSDYWELYVLGLAQTATSATSYGDFVDSASALQNSDTASTLITDQPTVQKRINDGYLAECADK